MVASRNIYVSTHTRARIHICITRRRYKIFNGPRQTSTRVYHESQSARPNENSILVQTRSGAACRLTEKGIVEGIWRTRNKTPLMRNLLRGDFSSRRRRKKIGTHVAFISRANCRRKSATQCRARI